MITAPATASARATRTAAQSAGGLAVWGLVLGTLLIGITTVATITVTFAKTGLTAGLY